MDEASLVEMVVVRVSPYVRADRPLLWLGEREAVAPRLLPIAIGEFEAAAIQMPLMGEEPVRPISYDLLSATLARLGVDVRRVIVERVEKSVFFARVVIEDAGDVRSIDSRPSDAVALALRVDAPIYVPSQLLEEVGVGPVDRDEDLERKLDSFQLMEPQITCAGSQCERESAAATSGSVAATSSADDVSALQRKLQRAVIREEYEEAARLRDRIESYGDGCTL